MKKYIAVFVLLFASLGHSYSQNLLSGIIYDKSTGTPIGYALVGINERYVGIVSDDKGRFVLKDSDKVLDSDSITITCLGYHAVKMAVKDVKGDSLDIYMEEASLLLDEVVVKAAHKKDIKIGYSSAGTKMIQAQLFIQSEMEGDNDELGKEIGVILKIKDDSDIKNLNFYLTGNSYDTIKLRILFYSVEDGLPKDIIVNQDIIFEIADKKRGWINVDLSTYNIRLDGDQKVAVVLMTLDETNRRPFSISGNFFSHTYVTRSKAWGEWKKIPAGISLYLGAVRDK